jgi:hypothetical protein
MHKYCISTSVGKFVRRPSRSFDRSLLLKCSSYIQYMLDFATLANGLCRAGSLIAGTSPGVRACRRAGSGKLIQTK